MASVKAWYKSKILWFNVGTAMLASVEATIGLLEPILGVPLYPAALFVVTVVNVGLRVVTTQGIGLSDQPEP